MPWAASPWTPIGRDDGAATTAGPAWRSPLGRPEGLDPISADLTPDIPVDSDDIQDIDDTDETDETNDADETETGDPAAVEVVVDGEIPAAVALPAPGPVPPTFAELGVVEPLVRALADQGIHTAFPIQAMAVPLALAGTDLIGQARTGTGKTLGFALPILQALARRTPEERADPRPRALVVAPTRELASQVAGEFRMAGKHLGAKVATIYGGRAYEPQITELAAGVDVVVGTPGRLLDLHGQRLLDLSAVGVLVLDEADEMLDLGFLPDVERIIAAVPQERQTMLFSATMPGAVVSLARRHLTSPVNLRAESAEDTQMVPLTTQFVYQAHAMDKIEIVARLLQARGRGLAMVFARTKRTAQRVAEDLAGRGFASAPLHGDLGQGAREQALRAFRAGKVDVLVCTDVAARGIDVDGITHVVNWACPEDERTYVHRIGRTGRAGATGVAVTFVDWEDVTRWRVINKALGLDFNEPQETYSTSPHLFADLDIPEGTKGTLPIADRSRAGLSAEAVEDLGGREPRTARTPAPTRGAHGPRTERPERADRPAHGESRPDGGAGRSRRRSSSTGDGEHTRRPAGETDRSQHGNREGRAERPAGTERTASGDRPAATGPAPAGDRSTSTERPTSGERATNTTYWASPSQAAPVVGGAARDGSGASAGAGGGDGAPRTRRRRRGGSDGETTAVAASSAASAVNGSSASSSALAATGPAVNATAGPSGGDGSDSPARRPRRRRRRSGAGGDSGASSVSGPTA